MNQHLYRLALNREAKPERLLKWVAALGGLAIVIGFAATKSVPLLLLHCGLLIIVAKVIQWADRSHAVEVVIDEDRIKIQGDLWKGEIPKKDLLEEGAAIVDLTEASELSPLLRLMGTGLFHYQSGWYLLRNGRRALIYLTDRKEVVYLPRKKGVALLVSVENPGSFLKELFQGKSLKMASA
jgi:hypothetical protein